MFSVTERAYSQNPVTSHLTNGGYSGPEIQKPNLGWSRNAKNQYELPIPPTTIPSFPPIINNNSGINQSLASTIQHQNRLSPTLSDKEFSSFPNILLPPSSTQSLHLPVRRVASEDSTTSSVPSMELGNLLTPSSTPAVNIESGYSSSKFNHDLYSLILRN